MVFIQIANSSYTDETDDLNLFVAAQVIGIPVGVDSKPSTLGFSSAILDPSRNLPTVGYTSTTFQQNKNPFSLFSSTVVGQKKNLPVGYTASNLQGYPTSTLQGYPASTLQGYPVTYTSNLVEEYQQPGVTLEKVRALRQWIREQAYLPGDYITGE